MASKSNQLSYVQQKLAEESNQKVQGYQGNLGENTDFEKRAKELEKMHEFEDELATFDAELNNYNKPVDHSKVLGIQHDKDGKLLVGEMNPGSGDQLKPDKGDID